MSTTATKGADSSVRARRGDDSARGWGKEKEPGAAFRGIPRGRGRGGGRSRAGGRGGGRGFSGKGPSEKAEPSKPSDAPSKVTLPSGRKVSGPSDTSLTSEKASTAIGDASNGSSQPKARGPAKGAFRPTVTVEPVPSRNVDASSPVTPSMSSSRRRRTSHKPALSTTLPKPLPSAVTNGLLISPSAPLLPTSSKDAKDLPPHILESADSVAPVHDLRTDIYSLVEHVRSIAMESHRPSSPSTHIDWAGDDDDSLPDLDDWGVSSKLISEADELVTNTASEPASVPSASREVTTAPVLGETEVVSKQAHDRPPLMDAAQSSADNPTYSTASALAPAKMERERRRERGSRREREKKALNLPDAVQVNSYSGGTQPLLTIPPKRGLLERLSSPVQPESLTSPSQRANQSRLEPKSSSTLPHHPSLPHKPAVRLSKPELPFKPAGLWRVNSSDNSPLTEADVLPQASEPTAAPVVREEPVEVNGVVEDKSSYPSHLPTEAKADYERINTSFDWSEEVVSVDNAITGPPKGPEVDIEPPTPLEKSVTPDVHVPKPLGEAASKSSPRFRSQRPLSTDITPRPRHERSPHNTHNTRNHSAPHFGPGLAAMRTRAPHATRPVIRLDALAMISRTLRDSPTPPRRESPAPAAVGTGE